jgi:DNA-binding NtrC family response regulator
LLARHFINKYAVKYNRPAFELKPHEVSKLMKYNWPGNIRELQNVMERAVILSNDASLDLNLPLKNTSALGYQFADDITLDELQRRYIKYVLQKTGGKIGGPRGAAELLGMKRTTLQKRMKKLGLP